MWKEENDSGVELEGGSKSSLGALGIRPGDVDSFEPTDIDDGDMGGADDILSDDGGSPLGDEIGDTEDAIQ